MILYVSGWQALKQTLETGIRPKEPSTRASPPLASKQLAPAADENAGSLPELRLPMADVRMWQQVAKPAAVTEVTLREGQDIYAAVAEAVAAGNEAAMAGANAGLAADEAVTEALSLADISKACSSAELAAAYSKVELAGQMAANIEQSLARVLPAQAADDAEQEEATLAVASKTTILAGAEANLSPLMQQEMLSEAGAGSEGDVSADEFDVPVELCCKDGTRAELSFEEAARELQRGFAPIAADLGLAADDGGDAEVDINAERGRDLDDVSIEVEDDGDDGDVGYEDGDMSETAAACLSRMAADDSDDDSFELNVEMS